MSEKGTLYVVVKVKDLLGYVTIIPQSSPKIYRFTYVNRMINVVMDALTCFLEANEIQINSKNWEKRGARRMDLQKQGISKLRLLSYLALITQESNVNILTSKQYFQIVERVDECIKYAQAWMRSDKERLNKFLNN